MMARSAKCTVDLFAIRTPCFLGLEYIFLICFGTYNEIEVALLPPTAVGGIEGACARMPNTHLAISD